MTYKIVKPQKLVEKYYKINQKNKTLYVLVAISERNLKALENHHFTNWGVSDIMNHREVGIRLSGVSSS